MKRITALTAVTAIAALSLVGQAFARSGAMTTRMTTPMPIASTSMQQVAKPGAMTTQGAMTGTAAKSMMPSGTTTVPQTMMQVPTGMMVGKQPYN